MNFPVTIINHTQAAVSVITGDSTGINYNQIKNSLGTQVYDVKKLYLYSSQFNQLVGVIQYNRYDVSGNQSLQSIVTTVDPYQGVNSIFVDLKGQPNPIVFNGNSNISTTILPRAYLQIKFFAKRVTNSFGRNLNNFRDIQIMTGTKFFDDTYGSPISEIQKSNEEIENSVIKKFEGNTSTPQQTVTTIKRKDNSYLILLSVAAVTAGLYFWHNEKK